MILNSVLYAQAPQQFSYQAVIRGSSNEILINKQVGMRLTIIKDSLKGKSIYSETQATTTNTNGLIEIKVGGGVNLLGDFTSIDWSKGPYFIKSETDTKGGTNYELTITSQLLSVPFALNSGNGISRVSITGDSLILSNGKSIQIPGISLSNHKPTSGFGPNISDIDGNTYKTVYIGTQLWMAENLKTSKFNDGTTIPNVIDNAQWSNLTTGAWSYYNNDIVNNLKYGKLYNWYVTNGNRNVCPTGWHVPTNDEWKILTNYLGGDTIAGGKMKEVGTTNWNSPNTDAANSSLFSAIPGGLRSIFGSFADNLKNGFWWSSNESSQNSAWFRILQSSDSKLTINNNDKTNGFSVRCIID